MKKLFFLIAVCAANYAFSQNQLLISDKKTSADAGKSSALHVSDSLQNPSANCTLDMKRTTDAGKGTAGNEVLKNDNPAPKELFLKNAGIIASPLKDEK
ncbi:MAG: hypothetical protein K0S33_2648 [Bacteroidetes bacterium]|jgi:hypothetical protein|nr:hypothetical protein [Bacteroidota bacterium]